MTEKEAPGPWGDGLWSPGSSCDPLLPLQCIVQSYLQWLQDSDYNPNCRLCNIPLAARETTRLICYGEAWAPWGWGYGQDQCDWFPAAPQAAGQ